MKVLTSVELAQEVAKLYKKPVLYISYFGSEYEEITKAAPYLSIEKHAQAILDGEAVIICDSLEEQQKLYWQTVGDDGPTKTNPYKGKARVYALTIDKTGQTQNENT